MKIMPLSRKLRSELGIEPVREGPYSWESNPAIKAVLA
jgi:hypothetical protein